MMWIQLGSLTRASPNPYGDERLVIGGEDVERTGSSQRTRGRVSGRADTTSRILEEQIAISQGDPSHKNLTEQAPTAHSMPGRPSAMRSPSAKHKTPGDWQLF